MIRQALPYNGRSCKLVAAARPMSNRASANDYRASTIKESAMKYLCLICAETLMEQMPEADAEKHYDEYSEFTEGIRRSGHFIGCNRLLPPDAAITVRVRNGKVSTTDGPFAETKEQLGGSSSRPGI